MNILINANSKYNKDFQRLPSCNSLLFKTTYLWMKSENNGNQ